MKQKELIAMLYTLLCVFISIIYAKGYQSTEERLYYVEESLQNYESMMTVKDEEIRKLHTHIMKQGQEFALLSQEVTRIGKEKSKLKDQMNHLNLEHQKSKSEQNTGLESRQAKGTPDIKYQHTAFGCMSDTISLSCPDDRTIFVTSAEYGMYGLVCDGGCCAPHPTLDCVETTEENSPQDWLALKIVCDNQTSCSFQYTGAIVDECSFGYTADYMQIYFNCLPEREAGVIGFTAYAGESRYYDENQVVIFDAIVSNFDGHYNPSTSIFTCPYNGVYWFDVSFKSTSGSRMRVTLSLEGASKVDGHAELGETDLEGHAAALLECTAGQNVWVRAYHDNSRMRGGYRLSTFSGFLLYQFN